MKRPEPALLSVGDACWLLVGTGLYEVEITEVRSILLGAPSQFYMYRVKCLSYNYHFISDESHHRSDLFLRPAERGQLVKRIQDDIQSLESLNKELKEDDDH